MKEKICYHYFESITHAWAMIFIFVFFSQFFFSSCVFFRVFVCNNWYKYKDVLESRLWTEKKYMVGTKDLKSFYSSMREISDITQPNACKKNSCISPFFFFYLLECDCAQHFDCINHFCFDLMPLDDSVCVR